jgi:hypothetical protein
MKILVLICSLIISTAALGQSSSGVLAPQRAINWSSAGISGGLPDGAWTQCGSTLTAASFGGSSGTPAAWSAINTVVSGCSAQTYVLLGAGTFFLTGTYTGKSQVTIRGQGANSTFIVASSPGSCNGVTAIFCLAGSNSFPGGEQNHATWTAGFAQGATSITLSNSLNITANSTFIQLDQQNEATDTGNIWNCLTVTGCGADQSNGGAARTDNTCASGVSPNVGFCDQVQSVMVTACSPSCNNSGSTVLTLATSLYMPNWASAKSTGAYWATTTVNEEGVENLSVDMTSASGASAVFIQNCAQCFWSGNRSIDGARNHAFLYEANHTLIQNSYFYGNKTSGTSSYGIEIFIGSDNLIQNNICQNMTVGCSNTTGGGEGNVISYNHVLPSSSNGTAFLAASSFDHAGGDAFNLWEGNFSNGYNADDIHGTHAFTTLFRNVFTGWQPLCNGSPCTTATDAIYLNAGSRYFNNVGNMLGQAGYHTNYACLAFGCTTNWNSVILAGVSDGNGATGFCANPPSCSTNNANYDPLTVNSLMNWGNYDVKTGAVRFCTANATPISACTGDERADAFGDTTATPSTYAGLASPSTTLPASFYLASKPSFFGSIAYPPIGPDVTSGNLLLCTSGTYNGSYVTANSQCGSGTSSAAYAGLANEIPAMACYLNTMGGPPDGSGSVLSFNANSCYAVATNGPNATGTWTGTFVIN